MIRRRLELLSTVFCIEIAPYAIMDNHLHLVLRLDPRGADDLVDEEVARRWLQAFPRQWDWTDAEAAPTVDAEAIATATATPELIEKWRARLANMGWCLKALKEPVARRCNNEDGCTGAFWEGRYKSIPLLDQVALVSCMAYVDLNPIRATAAATPEQSDYTSIQERISLRQLFEKQHGLRQRLHSTTLVTSLAAHQIHGPEDRLWLTPIKACTRLDLALDFINDHRDFTWLVRDMCPGKLARCSNIKEWSKYGNVRFGRSGFALTYAKIRLKNIDHLLSASCRVSPTT